MRVEFWGSGLVRVEVEFWGNAPNLVERVRLRCGGGGCAVWRSEFRVQEWEGDVRKEVEDCMSAPNMWGLF